MVPQSFSHIHHLADEIRRYLKRHPKAADTAEGVATWWLLQQRFHDSLLQVTEALEHLATEGTVEILEQQNGKKIYRLRKPGPPAFEKKHNSVL